MNIHNDKEQKSKPQSVANKTSQSQNISEPAFQFVDNRPETTAKKKLQEIANHSPKATDAAQLQSIVYNHSDRQQSVQRNENKTGLPDNLKSGIEDLSGYSMDDVKVNYNSDKPAQLEAHAYAQGTDIHIAAGQEKHLPHEAWHVVQQKQGRVQPTLQMNEKVNINDDAGLEKEADVMGRKSMNTIQPKHKEVKSSGPFSSETKTVTQLARNSAIKKAKERVSREQSWRQLLVQSGLTLTQATVLAAGLANSGISFPTLRIFIPLILTHGWNENNLLSLIRRYQGAAGVCNAQQWVTIAAVGTFVDHEADVAYFARIVGWTPANIATMAGLFNANNGVCNAQQWAAIAIVPAFVDQEADVARFARIAGWTPANIITMAGLFNANNGVCNAQQWAAIAVVAAFVDHETDVAHFARIAGWAPANIATMAGLFNANNGVCNAQQWAAIAVVAAFVDHETDVAQFARIAGWTPANIATMAGLLNANNGVCNAQQWAAIAVVAAFVDHETDVAHFARIAGWTPANIATMAGLFNANNGVCNAQQWAAIAVVVAFVDHETDVAQFARIAGWTPANIATMAGLFNANNGVCNAQQWAAIAIVAAFVDHETDVAHFARVAGWTPANIATMAGLLNANNGVCNAQQWAQISIAHAGLIDQEAGVADLARMAGWTPAHIPTFATGALNTGLNLAGLRAFITTANATANCLNLIGWGAGVVGTTVGRMRTAGGAPNAAETTLLLGFAHVHGWTAAHLQSATAAAACGAPNWGNVIGHAPTFAGNWGGAAGPGGMGGGVVANNTFAGGYFGGGYQVRLRLRQQRVNHVRNGHSFDSFALTYVNSVRNGVGGNITFYALGTNVTNRVSAHVTSAAGETLADSVAATYPVSGNNPNSFRQANMGGDRVGIASNGNRFGGGGGTYPTALTQCYPLAGTQIVGRNLVAIGRLMGQIP